MDHVADVRSYMEGVFVIIVGDRRLAEEPGVGHATVAEAEEFLRWLSKEVPAVYKPYMHGPPPRPKGRGLPLGGEVPSSRPHWRLGRGSWGWPGPAPRAICRRPSTPRVRPRGVCGWPRSYGIRLPHNPNLSPSAEERRRQPDGSRGADSLLEAPAVAKRIATRRTSGRGLRIRPSLFASRNDLPVSTPWFIACWISRAGRR